MIKIATPKFKPPPLIVNQYLLIEVSTNYPQFFLTEMLSVNFEFLSNSYYPGREK